MLVFAPFHGYCCLLGVPPHRSTQGPIFTFRAAGQVNYGIYNLIRTPYATICILEKLHDGLRVRCDSTNISHYHVRPMICSLSQWPSSVLLQQGGCWRALTLKLGWWWRGGLCLPEIAKEAAGWNVGLVHIVPSDGKLPITIMATHVQRYPRGDLYTALSPIPLPFLLSLGESSWWSSSYSWLH